jgi:dTDP-4-dehydrorhamnose reductase
MPNLTFNAMKILVTGAKGQLGKEIEAISKEYKQFEFLFTDVEELDITNKQKVDDFFEANSSVSYLINCAAYTAVDKAEDEPDKALLINATASKYLAEACKKWDILPIHISTDYVFDGTANQPVDEDTPTNPRSVYGETKLLGEKAMLQTMPDAIVIRTSWLYSRFGKNFVKSILHYGAERGELNVVFDQTGTPTHAADLARTILTILEKTYKQPEFWKPGVYHYSNEGVCSWYDFAVVSVQLAGIDCKISPVTSDQYPQKASRPAYSVLNKAKIRSTFDISIPYWVDSLKNYFEMQH